MSSKFDEVYEEKTMDSLVELHPPESTKSLITDTPQIILLNTIKLLLCRAFDLSTDAVNMYTTQATINESIQKFVQNVLWVHKLINNDNKHDINKSMGDSTDNMCVIVMYGDTSLDILQPPYIPQPNHTVLQCLYIYTTVNDSRVTNSSCNVHSILSYGVLPIYNVDTVHSLIKHLFIDSQSFSSITNESNDINPSSDVITSQHNTSVNHEFMSQLHKFMSTIDYSIEQIQHNIKLPLPQLIQQRSDTQQLANDNQPLIEELLGNELLINELELCCNEWITIITNVLEGENNKKTYNDTPLAELQYWSNRNNVLSLLYEQFITVQMKLCIHILELSHIYSIELLRKQLSELLKYYIESNDNHKFLQTLDRHFHTLQYGTVHDIQEIIPTMLNSCRMIWIISRHYNKDYRMAPLLERIAMTIQYKIQHNINVKAIFILFHTNDKSNITNMQNISDSIQSTLSHIQLCSNVLSSWYNSYMAVRDKIDANGTNDRKWEFNRNKLFDATNYMSTICNNLIDIISTIKQFYVFLTPELQSVAGELSDTHTVRQSINELIYPLTQLPYNIFDSRYQSSWNQCLVEFKTKVSQIELLTNSLIDQSFTRLRSAESAYELLCNYYDVQNSTNNNTNVSDSSTAASADNHNSINQQITSKFHDILNQYESELHSIQCIFDQYKHNPPISRNQPPVAGSILWSRTLYYRIKKTILRFQSIPSLLSSAHGVSVCELYVALAKQLTQYEISQLNTWKSNVVDICSEHLKYNILRYDEPLLPIPNNDENYNKSTNQHQTTQHRSINQSGQPPPPANKNITQQSMLHPPPSIRQSVIHQSMRNPSKQHKPPLQSHASIPGNSGTHTTSSNSSQHTNTQLLQQIQRKIVVNFSNELIQIIRECKYLQQLQLSTEIPEIVKNVTLHEQKYYILIESLEYMLTFYLNVVNKLNQHEKYLLIQKLCSLHQTLQSGFNPLNWNSLNINLYIDNCNRHITQFDTVVHSIHKNTTLLHNCIQFIKHIKLIHLESNQLNQSNHINPISGSSNKPAMYNINELYDTLENYRLSQISELLTKYTLMTRLLLIIELHVCDTETGTSQLLQPYYTYWENEIFNALTHMITYNMQLLRQLLQNTEQPLIHVSIEIQSSHITIQPNIHDIYKILSKLLRNIPETSKQLIRWMNGTCHTCPPVKISTNDSSQPGTDDQFYTYTFYDDLSKNSVIVPLVLDVTQHIQAVIHSVDKYIDYWNIYGEKQYNIWNQKKLLSLDRLKTNERYNQLLYYEQHIIKYQYLANTVNDMSRMKSIEFICIDNQNVISTIVSQCKLWCSTYCDILHYHTTQLLLNTQTQISNYYDQLKLCGTTQDYIVLYDSLQKQSIDMDLILIDLDERYRALHMYYDGNASAEHIEQSNGLGDKWDELIDTVKLALNSAISNDNERNNHDMVDDIQNLIISVDSADPVTVE